MPGQQVVALVGGANRVLDERFTEELRDRGAKVHAAARRPESVRRAVEVATRASLLGGRLSAAE